MRTVAFAHRSAGALLGALCLLALAALSAPATPPLAAQQEGRRLTLEEALDLARRNNPGFLMQANDQVPADWGVRAAYGSFLPSASANTGLNYRRAGVTRFETVDLGVQGTDYVSSSYGLGVSWSVGGSEVFGLSSAQAGAAATAARIDNARFSLEQAVTLQYMAALRAGDALEVARRQMERARRNLELVRTRVETGAAAGVEGKQAEMELGRAEVALLQAERASRTEKLRLMEQLGVDVGEDVTLASQFEVFEPDWTLEALLSHALADHPALRAQAAQEQLSRAGLRQARSQYFPRLSVSTGFSGFTQQARNEAFVIGSQERSRAQSYERCTAWQEVGNQLGVIFPDFGSCGSPTLSEEQKAQILASNQAFPFDFTKNPLSFSMTLSVPVFNGFSRERSLSQAEAAAKDAEHQRRAEELRIRTNVTDQLEGLRVQYRVVGIEARNRDLAQERLTLARQRYALGAAGVLELLDAETSMSQAERDHLNAIYQFHQALVILEANTGRSLRAASR